LKKFCGLIELLLFFVEVGTKLSFLAHQIDIQIYDGRGVFIDLLTQTYVPQRRLQS